MSFQRREMTAVASKLHSVKTFFDGTLSTTWFMKPIFGHTASAIVSWLRQNYFFISVNGIIYGIIYVTTIYEAVICHHAHDANHH
jgi:hypothetical protein